MKYPDLYCVDSAASTINHRFCENMSGIIDWLNIDWCPLFGDRIGTYSSDMLLCNV